MAHGGARPGAGRKPGPGRPHKRTQLALRRWAYRNLNPADPSIPAQDVMRDNLMYWHLRAREEAMTLREFFVANNATPEQLLKIVALYHRARDKSQEVARDLIPYETPKLSQLTIATLDLNQFDDSALNQALLSMGSDVEALYQEIVTDVEPEPEPVPAAAE